MTVRWGASPMTVLWGANPMTILWGTTLYASVHVAWNKCLVHTPRERYSQVAVRLHPVVVVVPVVLELVVLVVQLLLQVV